MPKVILGVDEVGRGPWAGPLVVGAVILGAKFQEDTELKPAYAEFTDSKKLSATKRAKLAKIIQESAIATGLGWVTSAEIDRYGLAAALKLAAQRAVKQVLASKQSFDEIVIDGTVNLLADTPLAKRVILLKKADLLVKEVSAASIIAKVARDTYMVNLGTKYPVYGFDKHVGYGTAAHKAALETYGPCPEHRQSFQPIKKISAQSATVQKTSLASKLGRNTTKIGHRAEQKVAEFLQTHRHRIIISNFRTKTCEIDLVSVHDQQIYFTEVKYRQNDLAGQALEQVTACKLQQMRAAVKEFLALHPEFQNLAPLLAVASVTGDNFVVQEWFTLN